METTSRKFFVTSHPQSTTQTIDMNTISIEQAYTLAVQFRHHLHAHPEFAMQETQTQHYIATILDHYHIPYTPVGTGLIASIGTGNDPCIAARADMDALKVNEETGLPFASLHPGLMHACGHDIHLAILLATTLLLKSRESSLPGTVKLIFQPSEERRPGGARLLLPELLKPPVPRAIFGQHVHPDLPVGHVGIRPGPFFASSDNLIITIQGKGTHAAMPHCGSDPILAAAHLVQHYQTLLTKYRDPLVPSVLSITSIHGGTCNNVIPDRVDLLGTVRTHDNAWRQRLFQLIDEQSPLIASLHGCQYQRLEQNDGLPVLINDPALTHLTLDNATRLFTSDHVHHPDPLTIGEDFAIYLQHIPGAFWLLGARPTNQPTMPPLHSPHFAPPDETMLTGIRLLLANCTSFPLLP